MSYVQHRPRRSQPVRVESEGAALEGDLTVPERAQGMVLFAHGSGSSRHSPRNQAVAASLNADGLGTLLLDLLTTEEEAIDQQTGYYRFDIDLLADRLVAATRWLTQGSETAELPIGYFGASTGAGAALIAAGMLPTHVSAVVSRGGRPELAGAWLGSVRAPTLLIVGGNDVPVLRLNQAALAQISADKALTIVPGATHLFEEPGALERVSRLAGDWLLRHMEGQRADAAA
jgi:putative phosphoribosyl transferase